MPYFQVTKFPEPKPCILLLAGLWSIVLTALSAGAAGAQNQSENAIRQNTNAGTVTLITGGADAVSDTYQQLASVLRVKSELGASPGIGYGSRQDVAPRLQSRIKKNQEFAAFAKFVQTRSNKSYSRKELSTLYLNYRAWLRKRSTKSQ